MTNQTPDINANRLFPNLNGNLKLPLLTQFPDTPVPTVTTPAHTPSPPATPNIVASTRTHTAKNVPAFLNKLYKMVDDSSTNELIRWSDDGASFIVTKHEEFAKEVLPRFFKHNNFSSFVRQLNMYGFHKIPHLQQGVLQADEGAEHWEFSNPHFLKNQPDLLCLVSRKRGREADEKEGGGLDLNNVMNEITAIRKHQFTISSDLKNLQRENQQLWQETLSSRERYNRQQETIDKILRFLASVFSSDKKSKEIIPRKRRLLLGNTDTSKSEDTQPEYEDYHDLNLDFDPSTIDLSSALSNPGFDPSIFASTHPNTAQYGSLPICTELFNNIPPAPTATATATSSSKATTPISTDILAPKPFLSQPTSAPSPSTQLTTTQFPNILPSTSKPLHAPPSRNPVMSTQPLGSLNSTPVKNDMHISPVQAVQNTSKSLEAITSEMDELNQNIESLASSLGIDPLLAGDPILDIGDVDMDEFLNNYPDVLEHNQVNHEQLLSMMAPSTDSDILGEIKASNHSF
ncbi:Heat shock transcription factor [Basidiobolus ranarum]|uniref:Heat shock transcription factor n=1 Tax=Basidiobolus ranarum TaxID=34480 RepID=A0ABR2WUD1_9FUNG